MSRKRGVQAARNNPSADRKYWQRIELGIHGLKSWDRNWFGTEKEEACTRKACAADGFTASHCGLSGTGFLNEPATGTALDIWRLDD